METQAIHRGRFALGYALRHALISLAVAGASALLVFGLLYRAPWADMLGVDGIFFILLAVDVVCGPLLTLVLASPHKSRRERWTDFSLVGLIQIAALLYGLHSLWLARPVVLAFETDRLVVVTANELLTDQLPQAPQGLQTLPAWGMLQVGTRPPKDNDEYMVSVDLGLKGISPALRPGWWLPWSAAQTGLKARAKPVTELLQRRSEQASALQAAIAATGHSADQLQYLPLTSSKTKNWIALLDAQMHMVGWAAVDGF